MKVIMISEDRLDKLVEARLEKMFAQAKTPNGDGGITHTDATVRCRVVNYDLRMLVDEIKNAGLGS